MEDGGSRRPRRRQDSDLPPRERAMNDHCAKDMYEHYYQSAVRENRNINDSDEEEPAEGYVKPEFDAAAAHERDALVRAREIEADMDRKAVITQLRSNKQHLSLPRLEQLTIELEVWNGLRSAESAQRSRTSLARRPSNTHRQAGEKGDGEREGDDALSSQALDQQRTFRLDRTPSYLRGQLRDYQIEGVNWLLDLRSRLCSGILADEMGLGKTFQTVALIAFVTYTLQLPGPHLVVVPKSVLGNWYREFKRWCPTLSVVKMHGSKETRGELINAFLRAPPYRFDIYLTTYDMILREASAFSRPLWHYVIVDEAHKLKNSDGSTYGTLTCLKSRHRLLITGTPLQNDMKELWALLSFLSPYLFHDSRVFTESFDPATATQEEIAKMHAIVGATMLRRLKSDVNTAIPPKREVYVSCGITPLQREWYLKVLAREAGQINRATGSREAIMNIIMQLRKAVNHPFLFPEADETGGYVTDERIVAACGKMIVLDKLLAKLKADEGARHKVLIFSQMTRMLDIIEDFLNLRGYTYFRIDGSTGGMDRDMQMASFNNPMSDVFIFLLSTRAGGLGINLQAANHVVIYDSDWNPQMDLQAQDRAHRIGQTREVRVYRFVTDKTVEERVYQRALKKLYLDALIVQSGRVHVKSKDNATREELMSMIRFGANEMFKSKGAEVTDADIDALLASGESRMQALQREILTEQTQTVANFDMGVQESNLYEFEGLTFTNDRSKVIVAEFDELMSAAAVTDIFAAFGKVTKVTMHPSCKMAIIAFNDLASAAQAVERAPFNCHYKTRDTEQLFITADMIDEHWGGGGRGKRERKEIMETIEDEMVRAAAARKIPAPKLPRRPTLNFWWLANDDRLLQLYELECAAIVRDWRRKHDAAKLIGTASEKLVDKDDDDAAAAVETAVGEPEGGLTAAQQAEKEDLWSRAFTDWTHADFTRFVKALTREGIPRTDYSAIAESMNCAKTAEDVERYSRAFWNIGPSRIPHFSRYEKAISAFAARREKAKHDAAMLQQKIEACPGDPEETLKFSVRPLPSADAALDRLVYLSAVDAGRVDFSGLRQKVKARPEFAFDIFIQSRPANFFETRARRLIHAVLSELRDPRDAEQSGQKKKRHRHDAISDDEEEKEEPHSVPRQHSVDS